MFNFKAIIIIFLFNVSVLGLEVPTLFFPITDKANIISSKVEKELNNVLTNTYESGSVQLHILTIPSLEGETLEDYSIKVANNWELGSKEKNNGVLLLISLSEGLVRIEVGSGAEGFLTDIESHEIIMKMTEKFKENDYDTGVISAVIQILEKAKIETSSPLLKEHAESNLEKISILIILLIIITLFITGNGHLALDFINIILIIIDFKSSGKSRGGGGRFSGGGSNGKWK